MSGIYTYDVFLSHAFEDKDEIANELDRRLRDANIKVWYSGRDLSMGEDLKETILKRVIPRSKFGVVVISKDYFMADWGRTELNLLHGLEATRNYKIILPVWHGVDEHQVKIQFPYLVERFAVKSERGIDQIAQQIITKVTEKRKYMPPLPPSLIERWWDKVLTGLRHAWVKVLLLAGALALAVAGTVFQDRIEVLLHSNVQFDEAIEERIAQGDKKAQTAYTNWLYRTDARPSGFARIRNARALFTGEQGCGQHVYSFHSVQSEETGKRPVTGAGINPDDFFSAYGMSTYDSHLDSSEQALGYAIANTAPVTYSITNIRIEKSRHDGTLKAVLHVTCEETLRCVITRLDHAKNGAGCAREHSMFYGLRPEEVYVFEKKAGKWWLTGVQ